MADQSRRPPSHAELMEPSIPDELTCTICLSLLCEPVFWPSATTSSCHHSFCRLCAFKVLRASQNPTCPLCREPAGDLSQLEAGDLNLDGPKYRQVLKAFPIPHNKQKREDRRELARLQGGEAEMPLHVVGDYALREGMTIALRIEPEDCGKSSLSNPSVSPRDPPSCRGDSAVARRSLKSSAVRSQAYSRRFSCRTRGR